MSTLQLAFVATGLVVDLALGGLPLWAWVRHGRDPRFTDDDSVLMPSPPPGLTPALASILLHGSASRRTISAGLMGLASHGLIAFSAEPVAIGHRAGLVLTRTRFEPQKLSAPEAALYLALHSAMVRSRHLDSLMLGTLGSAFTDFIRALEQAAVERGWVHANPGAVIRKWRILAGLEAIAGVLLIGWVSRLFESSSQLSPIAIAVVGFGTLVAGAVTYVASEAMPARTEEGAMLAAMLNAYRRTLEAAIAQAKSLQQVVVMKPLPWVETPTEEIAWAVAFNLDRQIDSLLSQSLEVSEVGGWPMGIRDWFSVF